MTSLIAALTALDYLPDLDHIEPSAIDLYKQLNNRLGDANLSSYRVDFCQAVSDEGFDALETVAAKMRQQIQ